VAGRTLVSASTYEKQLREAVSHGSTVPAALEVGTLIAKRALEAGVTQVVYDRGGNVYHGRIKALAEAAREAGLDF
jgi:large subunit ribosomal protein L18